MEIREEFDKRISEIGIYFEILEAIELDKPKLSSFDVIEERKKELIFDSQRINIFRASAFLMLYNLVESTIYNSIVLIFEAINSEKHVPKLKYYDVIDEVKTYWLRNIYKHDERMEKHTIINKFKEITDRIFNDSIILASTYIRHGGSLDASTINETAKSLGVKLGYLIKNYKKETHGEALMEIKQKRNWLAHGEKSFAEIGQDYPFIRLDDWRKYIVEHLEKFILSIEDYIKNEDYKMRNTIEITSAEILNGQISLK